MTPDELAAILTEKSVAACFDETDDEESLGTTLGFDEHYARKVVVPVVSAPWEAEVRTLTELLAERDAAISRVRGFAEVGATTARARGQFEFERRWLDLLHILDQAALAGVGQPEPMCGAMCECDECGPRGAGQ